MTKKSLKFEIVPSVSYWANFFFFVSNLSNWHFSCRSSYNEFWLSKTGPLSKDEEKALRQARQLFKKFGFGKKYWGLIFLREDESLVWKKAKDFFGPEISKFERIADIFKPRFEKIWPEEEKLLKSWLERLNGIKEKLVPEGLVKNLDILFGDFYRKKGVSSVNVTLLMSAGEQKGGGGNLGPGAITLEISRVPLNDLRPTVLLMWHEIVHSVWQTGKYQRMLKRFSESLPEKYFLSNSRKIPLRVVVNEGITESLFPHGYLSEKHFGFPVKEHFDKELGRSKKLSDKMRYWRNLSAYILSPLVKEYLEKNKLIDKLFLERTYSLWKSI